MLLEIFKKDNCFAPERPGSIACVQEGGCSFSPADKPTQRAHGQRRHPSDSTRGCPPAEAQPRGHRDGHGDPGTAPSPRPRCPLQPFWFVCLFGTFRVRIPAGIKASGSSLRSARGGFKARALSFG